jgi:hypothetical protein
MNAATKLGPGKVFLEVGPEVGRLMRSSSVIAIINNYSVRPDNDEPVFAVQNPTPVASRRNDLGKWNCNTTYVTSTFASS